MRALLAVILIGCTSAPEPALQIVGESTRLRLEDPLVGESPWFDGSRVTLVAARGETLGIQVVQRGGERVALAIDGARVRGFAVEAFPVSRPSTAMYGGSQGAGTYADALTETATPATNPAYFEIAVARDATPGVHRGTLTVGARTLPVVLTIAEVTLPRLPLGVWSYGDPRELVWAKDPTGDPPRATPSAAELACMAMFREHGVLLSPDLRLDWWPERAHLFEGFDHIPVVLSKNPSAAFDEVRGWVAATRGTGKVPFAIPIDEPRTLDAKLRVRVLAEVVRAAGGGKFRFAVTDAPRPEYGDAIDLYIQWGAAHLAGDSVDRWTYNGAPPYAGSSVLDAETPGARTWGWIAWRWSIPVWYVWDALYWHDRHNRRGAPLPGTKLDPRIDPVSFDDGEDHGNLDGVLALPGCQPTLRLAAIRRGLQDRQLLELAARCDPAATRALAARLVPEALGDAPSHGEPSWPTTEGGWELARRQLIDLARCAAVAGG